MTYLSGGDFASDLEFVFGPLKKRRKPLEKRTFDEFEDDLNTELQALFDLFRTYELPELAGMRWSHFISMADSWGADEQELIDDWGAEPDSAELLVQTLEFMNDGGNPFWTVGDAGVCIAFDDPFEANVWFDDFGGFLQFLVNLSGAANGRVSLAELTEHYADEIETSEGEMFLERCLEEAQAFVEDVAFEEALDDELETFDPEGLSFLFTGKLASMTRKEAESRVDKLGGKNAKSVTKTLDVLVIGDDGSPLYGEGTKGSKQKKADKLISEGAGIRIISESLFLQL